MAKTCGFCEKSVPAGGTANAEGTVIYCRCSITGKTHSDDHPCDVAEKPRLCEVLGVDVGERFCFDDQGDPFGPFVIMENGQVVRADLKGIFPHVRFLSDAINHPETIIRMPRLTPEELRRCRAFGAKWVSRDESSELVHLWETEPELQPGGVWAGGTSCVQAWDRFFPSVQPGQLIRVEDEPSEGAVEQ